MELWKLAKDDDSGRNGCQTVYATDTPYLVIQGPVADSTTIARLENLLGGESAVIIKREVVEAALAQLHEQERASS